MRTNKYTGICYKCKNVVDKGKGRFEKHKNGFRVQHTECVKKDGAK